MPSPGSCESLLPSLVEITLTAQSPRCLPSHHSTAGVSHRYSNVNSLFRRLYLADVCYPFHRDSALWLSRSCSDVPDNVVLHSRLRRQPSVRDVLPRYSCYRLYGAKLVFVFVVAVLIIAVFLVSILG